jgi:hypothetical protein
MPHDGIVLTEEARCEGLSYGLLLEEAEGTKAAVCKEDVVGHVEVQAKI